MEMRWPRGSQLMSEAMVQVRNVQKSYMRGKQTVEVLHGLSLDIPRGDFAALMGPSGSGMRLLLGRLVPEQPLQQCVDGRLVALLAARHGLLGPVQEVAGDVPRHRHAGCPPRPGQLEPDPVARRIRRDGR